jgi:hypothetical protein
VEAQQCVELTGTNRPRTWQLTFGCTRSLCSSGGFRRAGAPERFGGHSGGETPGPIPNPEVKPSSADGTAREAGWESRSPPRLLPKRRHCAALRRLRGQVVPRTACVFTKRRPVGRRFVVSRGPVPSACAFPPLPARCATWRTTSHAQAAARPHRAAVPPAAPDANPPTAAAAPSARHAGATAAPPAPGPRAVPAIAPAVPALPGPAARPGPARTVELASGAVVRQGRGTAPRLGGVIEGRGRRAAPLPGGAVARQGR